VWREFSHRPDWRALLGPAEGALLPPRRWLIKRAVHRGKGVSLATTAELLNASSDARALLALHPDAVVQRYVDAAFLVGGRKLSLRLYSLLTCSRPLRVYLYTEGFALFATDEYESDSTERLAILTNAAVNKRGVGPGGCARGDEHRAAEHWRRQLV